jgi:phage shock protein PspC (stress-responsive transcriptional regulator)
MKKTVSVNIKGLNFVIEEDAYELLQDYIDRLERTLKHEEDGKEIIEDVELRIAELCSARLNDNKTVIELSDIEEIIAALGDPSQFIDEEEQEKSNTQEGSKFTSSSNDRRLFRDVDNATIGGVCAGVAGYFNIDVVIVRAVFLALFLFGGTGFPLYVILWIIIPKAESTIDRLRMKGRPITVETVKEEVENAAERIKNESQTLASKLRNDSSYKKRISRGRKILTSILGLGFIGMGILMLIAFLVLVISGYQLVPVQGDVGYISLTEFGELALSNANDVEWAWIGGLMASLSAILFCLLLGTTLLVHIHTKWTKYSLGFLFVIGFIGSLIIGGVAIRSGQDITVEGEIEKIIGDVQSDELTIIPQLDKFKGEDSYHVKSTGNVGIFGVEGKNLTRYGVEISFVPSKDSVFHVKHNLRASSKTHKGALAKSKNIKHFVELEGDSLFLDVKYLFPKKDKLRGQNVSVVIEIPEGKTVRLKDRIIHLGAEDRDDDIEHPYYKEYGRIRSDGSYDHWYDD